MKIPKKELDILNDRLFNYYFKEGEEVMFDPNLIKYYIKNFKFDKKLITAFIGRKGIIESCTSDCDCYPRGSTWLCTVRFGESFMNYFTFTSMSGCFIPYKAPNTNNIPSPKIND